MAPGLSSIALYWSPEGTSYGVPEPGPPWNGPVNHKPPVLRDVAPAAQRKTAMRATATTAANVAIWGAQTQAGSGRTEGNARGAWWDLSRKVGFDKRQSASCLFSVAGTDDVYFRLKPLRTPLGVHTLPGKHTTPIIRVSS